MARVQGFRSGVKPESVILEQDLEISGKHQNFGQAYQGDNYPEESAPGIIRKEAPNNNTRSRDKRGPSRYKIAINH